MFRVPSPIALALALVGLGAACAACGGNANTVESEFAFPLTDATSTSPSSSSPSRAASESKSGSSIDSLNDDQREQLKVALRRGGEKARQCNSVAKASVSGEGDVQVVFDGKIGKSVDATVGAPFSGTPIESCVRRAFIEEIVLPFEGTLTVPYTLKIEAPAAEPTSKAKKK